MLYTQQVCFTSMILTDWDTAIKRIGLFQTMRYFSWTMATTQHLRRPKWGWRPGSESGELGQVVARNQCLRPEHFWWHPPRCPCRWDGAGTWACTWGCSLGSCCWCCCSSGCSLSSSGTRWGNQCCSPLALSDRLALIKGCSECCERCDKNLPKTVPGLGFVIELEGAFSDSCLRMLICS